MIEDIELSEDVDTLADSEKRPAESRRSPASEGTAADFLHEYIGALNSAEFGAQRSDMSKDSGKKFAASLYERHLRAPRL